MKLRTQEQVVAKYVRELRNLLGNSKPVITALTKIAEEYIRFASAIVTCIEKHLKKVPVELKLAVVYLIDSILKNVGKEYINLFSSNIVSNFTKTFEEICQIKDGNPKWKLQMNKVRNTWTNIFAERTLYNIDCICRMANSNWSVNPVLVGSTRIHVNPKFLSRALRKDGATESQASVAKMGKFDPRTTTSELSVDSSYVGDGDDDEVCELQKQLLLKQKHLLELQTRKVQIELYETKSMLAGKKLLNSPPQINVIPKESADQVLPREGNQRTVESPSLSTSYKSLCVGLGNPPSIKRDTSIEGNVSPSMLHTTAGIREAISISKTRNNKVNSEVSSLKTDSGFRQSENVLSPNSKSCPDNIKHNKSDGNCYDSFKSTHVTVHLNSLSMSGQVSVGQKHSQAELPMNSTNQVRTASGISLECDFRAQVSASLLCKDHECFDPKETNLDMYAEDRYRGASWRNTEPTKRTCQADGFSNSSKVKKVKQDGFHSANDFQDTDLRQGYQNSSCDPLSKGLVEAETSDWCLPESRDHTFSKRNKVECDERFLFYSGCPPDSNDPTIWNAESSSGSGLCASPIISTNVDISHLYVRRQQPNGPNPFVEAMHHNNCTNLSINSGNLLQLDLARRDTDATMIATSRNRSHLHCSNAQGNTIGGSKISATPTEKKTAVKNENQHESCQVFEKSSENSKRTNDFRPEVSSNNRQNNDYVVPEPSTERRNESMQDLLSKLMAAGLLTEKSSKDKEEVSVQTTNTSSNIRKKNRIRTKKAVEPVPNVDLNFQDLKQRQSTLVAQLWSGNQCSSCGWRFSDALSNKFSQHLDWHFKKNRKMKDKTRNVCRRQFYYCLSDWLQYSEFDDGESKPRSFFAIKDDSPAEQEIDELPESDEPTTILCAGHEGTVCPQCGEDFEVFFDESNEDWRFRGAVLYHNYETKLTSPYHILCHKDLLACLEGKSVISAIIVGHGKLDDDDEIDASMKLDIRHTEEVTIIGDDTSANINEVILEVGDVTTTKVESLPSPLLEPVSVVPLGNTMSHGLNEIEPVPAISETCSDELEQIVKDQPVDSASGTEKTSKSSRITDLLVNDTASGNHPANLGDSETTETAMNGDINTHNDKDLLVENNLPDKIMIESKLPLLELPPRKFTVYPPKARGKETSGLCSIC